MDTLDNKLDCLHRKLGESGGCVVAFSGGVDSSLLLAEAAQVLGDKVLAVTVVSAVHPASELDGAVALAKRLGVEHLLVESGEPDTPGFRHNPPDRCYHCKLGRYTGLLEIAKERGYTHLFDGSNADDAGDYRPGRRAAKETGVRGPLEECGITKAEVRELSRRRGLPTWDMPAAACLATRFPYGTEITREGLARVEAAEKALAGMGISGARVRVHGDVARVEVRPEDIELIVSKLRAKVTAALKAAGFAYVALDLEGYRTGAMNETLEEADGVDACKEG